MRSYGVGGVRGRRSKKLAEQSIEGVSTTKFAERAPWHGLTWSSGGEVWELDEMVLGKLQSCGRSWMLVFAGRTVPDFP